MTETEIMKGFEEKLDLIGSMTAVNLDEEDGYSLYCVMSEILALLNRKNAKIEKLNFENLQMVASIKGLKAEAIKEFAEMVGDNGFIYGREIKQVAKERGGEKALKEREKE